MRYSEIARIGLLVVCATASMTSWAQADPAVPGDEPLQQKSQVSGPVAETKFKLPVDVAGYFGVRYTNADDLSLHSSYLEYSASLFLSKTIGRWRFHSELNVTSSPEFASEGILLAPRQGDFSVKLDTMSLNYNLRDWLQVQAGFVFVPTYWREHRYQSTTLPVDDPMIDETVFPSAFKGIAIHGDKYFKDGGFSYEVYGGVDQQSDFNQLKATTERSRALGVKFVAHLPSRHFFEVFDIGFHRLRRSPQDGSIDQLYGVEFHLEKGRIGVLSEFAHASMDIVNGHRDHIRQGYYVQPSFRINRKLFAVANFDRLVRDNRLATKNAFARQSVGLTYRPIPALSLKLEGARYEPQAGRLPAYYGPAFSVVYFFHLP
jgi:hypothetical protein